MNLKKITVAASLIIITGLIVSSCYKDKEDLLYPNNCISAADVKGPKYAAVESLINSTCGGGGCHLSGGNEGGFNFDGTCSIINSWSEINNSCVNNSRMPKGSPFNASQKQIITDWVNAGHKYTD